jgi:hypothetical protein
MVLDALTAPKEDSSTPNARRDDCFLTRRCLQGNDPFSARGPHRAQGEGPDRLGWQAKARRDSSKSRVVSRVLFI